MRKGRARLLGLVALLVGHRSARWRCGGSPTSATTTPWPTWHRRRSDATRRSSSTAPARTRSSSRPRERRGDRRRLRGRRSRVRPRRRRGARRRRWCCSTRAATRSTSTGDGTELRPRRGQGHRRGHGRDRGHRRLRPDGELRRPRGDGPGRPRPVERRHCDAARRRRRPRRRHRPVRPRPGARRAAAGRPWPAARVRRSGRPPGRWRRRSLRRTPTLPVPRRTRCRLRSSRLDRSGPPG